MRTDSVSTMPAPRFTVLIPSYNRAHLLLRALDSVAAQICRDFEIVVVDDGSTDGTAAAVSDWSRHCGQPLTLVSQSHAGVHAAYNRGVAVSRGELVAVLGSDDVLLPDALLRMTRAWQAIAAESRAQYCGIAGHGVHWRGGDLVGDPYPADIWDADYLELTLRQRIGGDKPGAYRRDLLLRHPFPVFAGEPFMRESFVLKQLALCYRTRYVNEAFQRFDYQRDGLSARVRELRLRSPRGLSLYFREDANRYTLGHGPGHRYAAHVRYVRYTLNSGTALGRLWEQARCKRWLLAALPAGLFKSLRDRCSLACRRRRQSVAQREPGLASFQRGSSTS